MAALSAMPVTGVVSRNPLGLSGGDVVFSLVGRGHRNIGSRGVVAHMGTVGDWVGPSQSKTITGKVFTIGGNPSAGTVVKLMRQADDQLIASSITDVNGLYSFTRAADDPLTYYVIGYNDATSPQVHGTSDRNRVPA